MQVVGKVAVFLHQVYILLAGGKFLHHAATLGSLSIGMSEVGNGYRFAAVLCSHPVAVG